MRLTWGRYLYASKAAENKVEGWSSIDLFRSAGLENVRIARLCFWDASGEFTLETFLSDVPLFVIETLIKEGKDEIKIS